MNIKQHFYLLFLLLAMPILLHSQATLPDSFAQVIEDLLNTEAVSNQEAAWLILEAAGITGAGISEGGISSFAEAWSYATEKQWLPKNAQSDSNARLDGISLLIMRAFNITGGLFYTLTKNAHYAYQELAYRNVLTGRIDPEMTVSGYNLLQLINRLLSFEEAKLLPKALSQQSIEESDE